MDEMADEDLFAAALLVVVLAVLAIGMTMVVIRFVVSG